MKKSAYLFGLLLFALGCKEDQKIPKVAPVDSLPQTEFVLTLEQPINLQNTQIYCSTGGYAWNEIKRIISNPLNISPSDNQLIWLNETKSFEQSLANEEIDITASIFDDMIEAKAVFKKSLPFEKKFRRNYWPLIFKDSTVECFGLYGGDEQLTKQVQILYYVDDNDFGIRLNPKDSDHEILLFTSEEPRAESMQDLYTQCFRKIPNSESIEKIAPWKLRFEYEDVLNIPIIEFNLDKNFQSLIGNQFTAGEDTFQIEKAYQRIALILDEAGAEVESEAEFAVATEEASIPEKKPKPKHLIFDSPYLLVLKRTDASNPYFVAWIANSELMQVGN
jgi:hypothetical protein